jgi:hypothetical protein
MVTLHGKEIKKGDRVWGLREGWVEVDYIDDTLSYPIDTAIGTYTIDGKVSYSDKFPTLFWDELEITKKAFVKPLPKLILDTKIIVWNNDDTTKKRCHFSNFYNDKIYCFNDGHTSWTADVTETTSWDNYELFEEI